MLVECTSLTIDTDEKGLVSERFDIREVMPGDELRHLLDPFFAFEEVLQVDRPVENFVQFFDIGHPLGFGKREELLVQCLVRNKHVVRSKLIVQWQGGAVLDAVGDGILVQIPFIVLAAEGLEGSLAVDGLVDRSTGESDNGGVGQTGHEEVAQIAAGCAVRLVDQNIDVRAHVDPRGHVAKLVDHRHDDTPIIIFQQLIEPGDAACMFQVAETERGEVPEHLVFQLVAVDHQQDGRFIRLRRTEQLFCGLDHREGLATALRVPDEPPTSFRIECTTDRCIHRTGLVLTQDVLVQFLVLFGKNDILFQKGQHLRNSAEALHLRFELADLFILPVENVPPHGIPAHPIGKPESVRGGKQLLRHEQFGRLPVVTADLVDSQSNRLILGGILALDDQHGNTVDQKNDILPRSVVPVMKRPLLGHFVHVSLRILVIDQNQVALPLLLVIKKLPPVTQMLHEIPVAVDVCMQMPELPKQRPLRFSIARIELPNLRVEQVIEEQGQPASPPFFRFLTRHNGPADSLGVCEDSGLDGFMFGRYGHGSMNNRLIEVPGIVPISRWFLPLTARK